MITIKIRMIETYRGLPRAMYIMFGATVINRFGEFVMPFLTMYLTLKIGLSIEVAGIIVTVASLIGIPSSFLGGKLADEFGRKKTFLIAQAGAALFLVPCAFLKDSVAIVICLMISTFFHSAVRPAMTAIITDILPPHQRQLGFSLQYLGINLGVALGPIVAGFLFNNLLPLLFIGDALTSFISLYLIWKYIKEVKKDNLQETIHTEEEKTESGSTLQVLFKRPHIILFLIIYIIYSFVYTQHRFSLPLATADSFGDSGASKFGVLMSVNAFTVLFFTVAVTAMTKHLKPLVNIAIAGILYAIGFGMLGLVHTYPLFILSTVIWTLGEILVVTNFGVHLANHSPGNFRARFNAIGSLSWSIGAALGTSVAGKFIEITDLNNIWLLTFFLSIVGMIAMFGIHILLEKKQKKIWS